MSSVNQTAGTLLYTAVTTDKPVVGTVQSGVTVTKRIDTTQAGSAVPEQLHLSDALEIISNAVALNHRSLSFSMDEISGRSVIKVVDSATDEVIRQIPTEEILKVAQDVKRLQEEMGKSIGLLIDNKV
ncbi:flagellar protein FlaG [Chromatiaceae bacterium AAb-1]|nr:flagellar protein FlaG [Chromatiaceae bacterium AAb-1]